MKETGRIWDLENCIEWSTSFGPLILNFYYYILITFILVFCYIDCEFTDKIQGITDYSELHIHFEIRVLQSY